MILFSLELFQIYVRELFIDTALSPLPISEAAFLGDSLVTLTLT